MIFFKKTVPLFPWSGKESICDFIRGHLDSSGKLHSAFEDLPDSKEFFQDQKIRWVGGMMDSLVGGHDKDANLVARKLYLLLKKQVSNPIDKNRRSTYLFAMQHEVIGYIDPLLEMIRKGFSFNSRVFKREAVWLATKSAHRNPVKLGIALLGLFQCDDQLDILITLGKHDEFTLYSVVAIQNGTENSNRHLFELAKHIDGWGKINLLQRLDPDTDEIKDWFLRKGCSNSIMNEYLAYTCAVKGNLNEALNQENIDLELFKGAGIIIDALISGGPAEDIDDYRDSMAVIVAYVGHSQRRASDLADYLVLANIKNYLEQEPEEWAKRWEAGWTEAIRANVLNDCIELMGRKVWTDLVWVEIDSKDHYKHYQAVRAGKILKLDLWPTLFSQLQEDNLNDSLYCDLMRTDDPRRVSQVAEFAVNALPLTEIASGPKDEMALGREFQTHSCLDYIIQELDCHEGVGKPLISTALWSPSIRNRNMALKVLKAWKPEFWPEDAKDILIKLQSAEPDEDIKNEVAELLENVGNLVTTNHG